MRKLVLLSFLVLYSVVSANTYYVAPDGDDSRTAVKAQNIETPWKTWGKAFTSASAGDTVFFRGGVYPMSVTNGNGYGSINDGTSGNLIYYWAYPADFESGNKPILDCGAIKASGDLNYGIYASASYCHFKGLTIRNVWAADDQDECLAWRIGGSNTIFEQCVAYNTHGVGFRAEGATNFKFINCDTYNNCDSLAANVPGNNGYGFASWNTSNATGSVYYYGCRAWNCGDDGFLFYSKSYVEVNNCWSFKNGQMEGGGNGYKLGFLPNAPYAALLRKVTNSIAAYNRAGGFTTNDNNVESISCQVYNNTSYHNVNFDGIYPSKTVGIKIYNTSYSDAGELKRIFKNNISYDNEDGNISVATNGLYTYSNNSWDIPLTISDADFISLDSTGLAGPRGTDGSLPDLDFLKLAPGSDLINAGTFVELPFSGSAPDLGYSEYNSGSITPPTPVYIISTIDNATPARLEMTYSLSLANIAPAASAFTVTVNSVTRSVSLVAISGAKVLLSLSSPVTFGNVVTVAYTKPPSNPLQSSSGGQASSISAQTVTNRVAAPVPVYISSAIENATPSWLELTYSLSLANIVPATSAFAVTVNSTARRVISVAISGTKVLLALSSPVAYGNTVTIAYSKPSTNPLQTTSGGQAETFSTKSVTNNLSPCINETFTSVSGTVTDNSGSSNYLNNMSCDKLIQPSGGGTITLTFTSFNTEANYDFVKVYAGSTTSAPLLGTFSGTSLPPVLTSSVGSMLIRFTTDVSVVAAGWRATYSSNVSVGCINETFTSVSGTVTDNSGSSNYLNNMSCDKLIQPSGGGTITLTFTSFNTEANYDFVKVYAGSTTSAPLLGTFSGTSLPPVLTSSVGSMLIRFTTDVSVVAAGWSATYITSESDGAKGTEDNAEQKILPKINLAANPNPTSEIPASDLVAYPNPTSGILIIKSSNKEEETYTIHLINLSGQIILNQRMNVIGGKFEIDLSNINSGFYLLRIITNRTVQLISVIKQ